MKIRIVENVNDYSFKALERTLGIETQADKPAAGERLGQASITDAAGFLLAKLHAAGSVLTNRALADFGLKERSYSVLVLANSGLEPTQRELADFLSLDPSQIVALVDDLEKRGLVVRAAGKQDRRAKTVTATPRGAKLQTQAAMAAKDAEVEALNGLAPEEAAVLKSLLRKALWSTP
jgi:DNA-binding MarR family transcriptional regulator